MLKIGKIYIIAIYGKVTSPLVSLKEFERQSIDKHFYKKKLKSPYRSRRRIFFKIWYLVAMATRGITLARNFQQLFVPPVH